MAKSEEDRLHALRQLKLLDTPPSESFDRITRLASQMFNLPISAVSLTDQDRQWFKSRVGVEHWQIPRERAPCGEVADTTAPLIITDMLASACYRDSLLAEAGIRFYAGAPLITREGFCLGAMCVLGTEPRQISEAETAALVDMAAMVMSQIELQHAVGRLDPATGLPNRHQLFEDLQDLARDHSGQARSIVLTELIASARKSEAVRILGVGAVDDLMREAARGLEKLLGADARLYQVGDTRIAWIIEASKRRAAERGLAALRRRMQAYLHKAELPLVADLVVGIAPIVLGESAGEDVLRQADGAAREARELGVVVNRYTVRTDEEHRRRFRLLADFRRASSGTGQLSLVYQPRVELLTGTCVGAEALLRWQHPELGAVSPGEFIPLVEQTELARPLTEWVVAEGIRQAGLWADKGLHLPVSVNVSATNLADAGFAAELAARIAAAGLPNRLLEVEITESAFMLDRKRVGENLQAIRNAGVLVAIDDFGTGYSSISYLRDLPADIVKIDQSFIRDLAGDAKARTLAQMVAEMARSLGFRVVAEGIEDQVSFDVLASWECDEGQGYWIARPLAAEALEAWVVTRERAVLRAA